MLPNVVANKASESWPTGQVPTGVGFFVSSDGYFLTAAHVVVGCRQVEIFTSDQIVLDATLIGLDTRADLALLYAPFGPFPVVNFAPSGLPATPLTVIAYGQSGQPAQQPVFLQLQHGTIDPGLAAVPLFRFPQGVPHGTSGSPLLGTDQLVYGMVIGRTPDGADSFAVGDAAIKPFLTYFGVKFSNTSANKSKTIKPSSARYGLLVQCQG
jgi:S1-C subfamily serine protease